MDQTGTELKPDSTFPLQAVHQGLRALGGLLGLLAMLFGILYASRIFNRLFAALKDPVALETTFQQWTHTLGLSELSLQIAENHIPLGNLFTILVLGLMLLLLVWLALKLVITGAKVLAWSLGEREAVKQILEHSLGKRQSGASRVSNSPGKAPVPPSARKPSAAPKS